MVRLIMTDRMVAAMHTCINHNGPDWLTDLSSPSSSSSSSSTPPLLTNPTAGQPITHTQIIAVANCLRQLTTDGKLDHPGNDNNDNTPGHLHQLLQGSGIYIEPPKPKPEPVSKLVVSSQEKTPPSPFATYLGSG